MINKRHELKDGKFCYLHRIGNDLIPQYFLVSFPKRWGEPGPANVQDMILFGLNEAAGLAQNHSQDPEAFTMIYSGYSARREKGWHVHIFLLGNRWRKAWLYLMLALKNLAQALRLRKDDAPRI